MQMVWNCSLQAANYWTGLNLCPCSFYCSQMTSRISASKLVSVLSKTGRSPPACPRVSAWAGRPGLSTDCRSAGRLHSCHWAWKCSKVSTGVVRISGPEMKSGIYADIRGWFSSEPYLMYGDSYTVPPPNEIVMIIHSSTMKTFSSAHTAENDPVMFLLWEVRNHCFSLMSFQDIEPLF
jgi:hypothetical protein